MLLPARLSRTGQLATVKALAPLSNREELSALAHVGITAELTVRRAVSGARGAIWTAYGLAGRRDLLVLREQLRAMEHRVRCLESSRG